MAQRDHSSNTSCSITTPDNLTVIVMEYAGHTWRLPKVQAISKSVPVTAPLPEDSKD